MRSTKRIAELVGEGVVLAVVGDPGGDRPFDRGGAEDGEGRSHRRARGERAMREVAMKADGDPGAGRDEHHREDQEVLPVQRTTPDLPAGEDEQQHGQDRDGDVRGLICPMVG